MMHSKKTNSLSRRNAIKTISLLGTGMFISPTLSATPLQSGKKKKPVNKELGILSIGVRKRGLAVAMGACNYGKMVACCDVDTAIFGAFQKKLASYQDQVPVYYTDYRQALERKDVDIVTIGTPDHWHALMIIDAIEAGKDVYVEKPMTLTIEEGIAVCEAVKRTGRVVQVGTQQRSEYNGIFLKAVAIAQLGILGNKLTASVYIPSSYGGSTEVFPVTEVPDSLLWNQWCGPVQKFPYTAERAHARWRLWVETGYGPLTDWGAHHIDIAQWALGADRK
jgi:myo-inositol 2-dehydrogenase / D-chiro-inositol 1-dehydrogenase